MIDTHCHLTYDGLFEHIEAVIDAATAAGVDRMISVGTTPDDARRAVALAERFSQVYATVGLHPHYADDWPDREPIERAMRELAGHRRVVALGEMGLDRHYPDPPIAGQQRALYWQLQVAAELDMPVIIHNREATDDTLTALRASGIAPERGVCHCCTGSVAELEAILDFGAMVSVTGIVTFNNARDLAEAVRGVPLDRLMIETDAPYLTPVPHRKVRTNEPRYVADVAAFLAQQRGMNIATFTARMDASAARFFQLDG